MYTPWLIRGWYAEAARHFGALTDASGATTAERITALCNHGFVLTMRARFDQAAALLTEAEALARTQDDATLTLTALYYRNIHARRLDDRQILPLNDVIRGLVATARGQLDDAEKYLRAAVEYAVADDSGVTHASIDLADLLIRPGELDEATALLDAVFAETPEHSTSWLAARAVATALAPAHGDRDRAGAVVAETGVAYTRTGFAWPRYATRTTAVRDAMTD